MFDLFEESVNTSWLDEMIDDIESTTPNQKPAEA